MLVVVSAPGPAPGRLRSAFSGTTPYSGVGVIFAVLGTVFVASILLSPGGWEWWLDARAVHGTETGGVVSYSYGGRTYSLDHAGSNGGGPRTVYLIPSDPAHGTLSETPTLLLDWGLTAGPYALAVALVAFGVAKRRRRDRELREGDLDSFGRGLGRATLDRLLDQQRSRPSKRFQPPEERD
jgi:hypothetical protein